MNRLFTILCMVSLLVFHTSCNDSVMDLDSPNVEIKTRAVDQRVQNLIQQARQGDVEAYNSWHYAIVMAMVLKKAAQHDLYVCYLQPKDRWRY